MKKSMSVVIAVISILTIVFIYLNLVKQKSLAEYIEPCVKIPKKVVQENKILSDYKTSDLICIALRGKYLFLNYSNAIYRYNYESKQIEKLYDQTGGYMFNDWIISPIINTRKDNIKDSTVSFINGMTKQIITLNIDEFEKYAKICLSSLMDFFYFDGTKFYFIWRSDSGEKNLSCYDLTNKTVKKIANIGFPDINADAESIYWCSNEYGKNLIHLYNIKNDSTKIIDISEKTNGRNSELILLKNHIYFFSGPLHGSSKLLCYVDIMNSNINTAVDFHSDGAMTRKGMWSTPIRNSFQSGFVYDEGKVFFSNDFHILTYTSGIGAVGIDEHRRFNENTKGLIFIHDDVLQNLQSFNK